MPPAKRVVMTHDMKASVLSLALWNHGNIELGIIYRPYTEEFFYAERGRGAFLNGRPIHVSAAKTIGESLVTVGTSPYRKNGQRKIFAFLKIYS